MESDSRYFEWERILEPEEALRELLAAFDLPASASTTQARNAALQAARKSMACHDTENGCLETYLSQGYPLKLWQIEKEGFTEWLRRQKKKDSPLGDFAADSCYDMNWPTTAKTLDEFQIYFNKTGKWHTVEDLLVEAWQKFTATR
ncbi:MAG: YozE family protein [Angustibacter sp.]